MNVETNSVVVAQITTTHENYSVGNRKCEYVSK
ncbi:hypothetical protein PBCVNY2B_852R [Paramecium bursaria Chlorella virus NY2B]|nr:hypothetical protein PBCVIL52s1_876R [Paramecium bursaria Chlorella virus IL-5-2s1]AGE58535.1 hypothetical protein PBCVNY2B_852R [Paramecium bursaria Chlorella virus NY2B]